MYYVGMYVVFKLYMAAWQIYSNLATQCHKNEAHHKLIYIATPFIKPAVNHCPSN